MNNQEYIDFKHAVVTANEKLKEARKAVYVVETLRELYTSQGKELSEKHLDDIKEELKEYLLYK